MSALEIHILRAQAGHAARLTQIAHAAKSYWGYPARWIELWRNQLTISAPYIEANEVWAAEVDGTLLGFYALTGHPPRMMLDHMWVMPVSIRQGIGTAMYRHTVQRALALGATCLEIEADPNAEGFYTHMGAVTVGEVSYLIDGLRRALPLMQADLTGAPTDAQHPGTYDLIASVPDSSTGDVAAASPIAIAG